MHKVLQDFRLGGKPQNILFPIGSYMLGITNNLFICVVTCMLNNIGKKYV